MQLCRRSYIVTDKETGTELEIDNKYIMSPKDLKTVRFIDRMMKAGVRVFKIEGRARGAEYVYTVVKCYKEAIQSVLDGTFTEEKKDEWTSAWQRCSTADSGTATTRDSALANGTRTMALTPLSARFTWARASSISLSSAWQSLRARRANSP